MQWKTRSAQSSSDPDWSVNVFNTGGEMRLTMFDYYRFKGFGDSGSGSLPASTWHQITVQYLFDRSVGAIQCWLNGTRWYSEAGIRTEHPSPFMDFGHERQWSCNNYTSGNSPALSSIWLDDASITLVPGAASLNPARSIGQRGSVAFA